MVFFLYSTTKCRKTIVMKKRKPKIMISSTVYGFEDDLTNLVLYLETVGYEVINSATCRMKTNSSHTFYEDCLLAVDECDLFLGIIRTNSGSGAYIDPADNVKKNITFEEMKKAVLLKKPYWFVADSKVILANSLFKKLEPIDKSISYSNIFDVVRLKSNDILDQMSLIIYNCIDKDGAKNKASQPGRWIQSYKTVSDIQQYIKTNFSDITAVRNEYKL